MQEFLSDSASSLPSIATNAANAEVQSGDFGSSPSLTKAETSVAQQQNTAGRIVARRCAYMRK